MHGWVSTALLVGSRSLGAFLCPVLDCDETFNYVETVHYMLFGRGLQTWEYSPEFALRTYAYVGMHAAAAVPLHQGLAMAHGESATILQGGLPAVGSVLPENRKVELYWMLRCSLGVICALGESYLVSGARKRFGNRVADITLVLLISNTGMFSAGAALLPSTTCMYMALFGFGAWLHGNTLLGLWCGAFAVVVCWPFCALLFVPMGLHAIVDKGLLTVAVVAVLSLVVFLGVPWVIDSWAYGKPTAAIVNLVKYNALGMGGGGEGANLYGTEPWHFYLQNLALNMNLVLPLALISPVVALLSKEMRWFALVVLCGPFLCIAMFTAMPHKEERFLSPTYPLLCMAAAISTSKLLDAGLWIIGGKSRNGALALKLMVHAGLLVSCLLSLSRSAALHKNFSAPVKVFEHFNNIAESSREPLGDVCIAKEWYRFPSSFFLPRGSEIRWLPSAFGGLLPQPFEPWSKGGPRIVHKHFNDRNKRDEHAFSSIKDCRYAVDLAVGDDNGAIGAWDKGWEKVYCVPFMDTSRSPAFKRSFYIPGYSEKTNVFADYCLLRRK